MPQHAPATPVDETTVAASNVGDQPAADDTLGFAPYVHAIAEFLTSPDTRPPLTLSVEGDWGTGKSSFMLQLEEELKRRDHLTVRFNPWRHDRAEELWATFALTFVRRLAKAERNLLRRLSASLWLRVQRFDWRAGAPALLATLALAVGLGWLAGTVLTGVRAEGWAWFEPVLDDEGAVRPLGLVRLLGGVGLIPLGWLVLRRAADLFGNPFAVDLERYLAAPAYEERVAFIEAFHDDFDRIVRAYTGLRGRGQRKVYVFIDDLDRCEVPRAADLLQAINLMISDSPRLVFILGLDREKVAAGLAVKFEDLLPYIDPDATSADDRPAPRVGLTFGYDFIEKFIQLPFRLPRPTDREIRRMLDGVGGEAPAPSEPPGDAASRIALEEIRRGEDSARVRDLVLMTAPAFDYNPRRVKQFLNTFRLKAHVCHRTGLFVEPEPGSEFHGLSLERLGKFVALSMCWPYLVTELEADPTLVDRLHAAAMQPDPPEQAGGDPAVRAWVSEPALVDLLRYGVPGPYGMHPDDPDAVLDAPERWSMERLDVRRLLRTAPAVPGRRDHGRSEPTGQEHARRPPSGRAATGAPPPPEPGAAEGRVRKDGETTRITPPEAAQKAAPESPETVRREPPPRSGDVGPPRKV